MRTPIPDIGVTLTDRHAHEKVAENELSVRKVAGETNPADLLTKGLARELLGRHLGFAGYQVLAEAPAVEATQVRASQLRRHEGPRGGSFLGAFTRSRRCADAPAAFGEESRTAPRKEEDTGQTFASTRPSDQVLHEDRGCARGAVCDITCLGRSSGPSGLA